MIPRASPPAREPQANAPNSLTTLNACGESAVEAAAILPAAPARVVLPTDDSLALQEGPLAMTWSPAAAGFNGRSAPVASPRLIDAVAASLAFGALSLCLAVTFTALSIQVCIATPF